MDVVLLDEHLRRTESVDSYESMIWTERFDESGDFILTIPTAIAEPGLYLQGSRLAIPEYSERLMTVSTTDEKMTEEGVKVLEIKGFSIEDVVKERPNQAEYITDEEGQITVVLTGTPKGIINAIFDEVCRENIVEPGDNINFLEEGEVNSPGSIPEPGDTITIRTSVETLYDTMKTVCNSYHLGYRLVWREGTTKADGANPSKLYFEVYTGDNRTSGQTTNTAMIFSPELDNLTDTSELTSTATLKNVAYVFAPNGMRVVYANGYDETLHGLERKVLIVKADDITLAAGPTLDAALDARGAQELAKYQIVVGFDGKISSKYVYGRDYNLGDLVEKRNDRGTSTIMRVTEQIFVNDKEGFRTYPTLLLDSLVDAGSWYALPGTTEWYDYVMEDWYDL